MDSAVMDWCEKWKWIWENQLRHGARKPRPLYLLFAGNDTVPTLMWRVGGMRCTECRDVEAANCCGVHASIWTRGPLTQTSFVSDWDTNSFDSYQVSSSNSGSRSQISQTTS